MKKYKIKNRMRFITFITIMMLVISFALSGAFSLIEAHSAEETEYIEITVESGDTLWQLAKTYCSVKGDIRELIYEICQLNDITASDLRAGQTLIIPVNH